MTYSTAHIRRYFWKYNSYRKYHKYIVSSNDTKFLIRKNFKHNADAENASQSLYSVENFFLYNRMH